MTDEIMYTLMEMSGAEYVDVYAAKAKEEAAGRTNGHAASRLPGAGLPRSRAS
jgi:1-acyl-sn-glycerol-3-phosphate acyltransferase